MSLEKGYLTQYEDVYDLPGRVYDTSKAVYGTIGSVMSLQKGYLTQYRVGTNLENTWKPGK